MWGRVGYSLSHYGKKKKKEGQEEREGLGGVGPLSQTFEGVGRCVPVAYFQFLETADGLNLLKVMPLNKLLTNTIKAGTMFAKICHGRFSKPKPAQDINHMLSNQPHSGSCLKCGQLQ